MNKSNIIIILPSERPVAALKSIVDYLIKPNDTVVLDRDFPLLLVEQERQRESASRSL